MNSRLEDLRSVSTEGLKKIGGGISGSIYAISDEQVLKVYTDTFTFEEVSHLYEVSRFLDANGINTARSYEIVNVNGAFGIIQQYIHGNPLPKLIAEGKTSRIDAAQLMGNLLVKLHGLKPGGEILPTLDTMFAGILDRCGDKLIPREKELLVSAISSLPCGNVVMHGDFHENNIMVNDDKFFLIDLDSVCIGSPLFEFFQIFCVYQTEMPKEMQEVLRLTPEDAKIFLRKIIEIYFDTKDASFIEKYYELFSQMGELNRFLAHFLMADGYSHEQLRAYASENIDRVVKEFDRAASACNGLEFRWK